MTGLAGHIHMGIAGHCFMVWQMTLAAGHRFLLRVR